MALPFAFLKRLLHTFRSATETSKAPAPWGACSLPNEIGAHTARPPSSALAPRVSTRTGVYIQTGETVQVGASSCAGGLPPSVEEAGDRFFRRRARNGFADQVGDRQHADVVRRLDGGARLDGIGDGE